MSASTVRKQDRLTQKLWLRHLGGGLSKHKWAVDKGGRGGGGGRRLGSLLKYGGRGSCWEERRRLNGIQYGTQPVTCKRGDRGRGDTPAYTMVRGFQWGSKKCDLIQVSSSHEVISCNTLGVRGYCGHICSMCRAKCGRKNIAQGLEWAQNSPGLDEVWKSRGLYWTSRVHSKWMVFP